MKVISLLIYLLLILSSQILAKETWILDKDLSTIEFELPLLLAHNVKGEFTEINGLVEKACSNYFMNESEQFFKNMIC